VWHPKLLKYYSPGGPPRGNRKAALSGGFGSFKIGGPSNLEDK